ncbi:MAG: copper chaperone PCu(A)C [Rhizomicrobium sp.]
MTKPFLAALALVLAAGTAEAEPLTVTDAWIRALPGGLPAAGYFTLHNATAKTVVLTGAGAADCAEFMLHRSDTSNGMAMMEDTTAIPVPPGKGIAFAPGGYHLMCLTPSARVKAGGHIPVTLYFAGGARLETVFAVRGATGR